MLKIRTHLPSLVSSGVRLTLSPTVPCAETTSNSKRMKAMLCPSSRCRMPFSVMVSKKTEKKMLSVYSKKSVRARVRFSGGTPRLWKTIWRSPRTWAAT